MAWPSGKAEDCKSSIRQFESGRHLFLIIQAVSVQADMCLLVVLAMPQLAIVALEGQGVGASQGLHAITIVDVIVHPTE